MVKVVAPIQFDADVKLYRYAADLLATDDQFYAGNLQVGQAVNVGLTGANPYIYFGSASDTNLYRGAAGWLKTDSNLVVGNTFGIDETNSGAAKGIYFGTSRDTNLYRSGVGMLKTDGSFFAQNIVTADRLYIGAAQDAQFLRWGPGQIRLYDATQVAALALKDIYVDVADTGGKAYFGGALDTNLYREGANLLRTDDSFHIGAGSYLCLNNGASGIPQIEFAYNGSNRQYRSYISTTAHGGVSDGNLMDFMVWRLADGPNGLGSQLALRLRGIGVAQAPMGLATRVIAGTPTDAYWETAPPDGMLVIDSSSNALWIRWGGGWGRIAAS